ncbi:Mpv17-like protein 2 [Hondaea fermentalgiana]|uniref:Mpv17-like protein 2 n=1 Tax=Hondaea fermentalgiana TaxID=2315210 RepID=A0A2R5GQ05_9STRA|nr:Mpv17-like protein 2 [Hondaea fermentalgiana]|eukprot:GBG31858.1 Mpv17-like protein 2 [Hondaea fermentalgiana]
MQAAVRSVRALPSRGWAAYNRGLTEAPLRTKVASACVIYGTGDVVVQKMQGMQQWDAPRTGRMLVYGAMWLSPFLHGWYRVLDVMVKGTGRTAAVQKIVLDQTFAATANMTMFHSINSYLETGSLNSVADRLRAKLWPTMLALWTIWPAVQYVNFTMVPLRQRVLVVNIVGVGWSMFLSYMGNTKTTPESLDAASRLVKRATAPNKALVN